VARKVWRVEVSSTAKRKDERYFRAESREEAAEAWGVELAAVSPEPLTRK
jgi:hypothetical protein